MRRTANGGPALCSANSRIGGWLPEFRRVPGRTQLRRIRRVVSAVEVAYACVVLRHQCASGRNEVEQLFVICCHSLLRVVGTNSEHEGSVAAQIFASEFFCRE